MSVELLGLGLKFMGGLIGQKSQDRQNRLQMQQAQKQFDAQMDQSVQRRVKDAKAAGVHPLFALGASAGASPTISAQGESRGNPMQSALSSMAQTINSLETNKAQAARDHAQAQLFDSERKRIEQELTNGSRGSDSEAQSTVKTFALPNDTGYIGPAEYYNPQVPTSSRQGVESGVYPARREIIDENGNVYTLPSPNMGMDEVGQVEYVLGIPGRMYNNIKKHMLSQREQKELEAELTRLRNVRNNPQKAAEYRALVKRAKTKARKIISWINQQKRRFD